MKRLVLLMGWHVIACASICAMDGDILTVHKVALRDGEMIVELRNHSSQAVVAWCLSVTSWAPEKQATLFVFDTRTKIGPADVAPIPAGDSGNSPVCMRGEQRPMVTVVGVLLEDGSFVGSEEGEVAIRNAKLAAERSQQSRSHFERLDKERIYEVIRRARTALNFLSSEPAH